jgi:hypothetical protein
LHDRAGEATVRAVRRLVFLALVPFLTAWALVAVELAYRPPVRPTNPSRSRAVSTSHDNPTAWPLSQQCGQPLADVSGTDMYGNEVSDAVAEYTVDNSGKPYEMHAPEVELPHLGSPKS